MDAWAGGPSVRGQRLLRGHEAVTSWPGCFSPDVLLLVKRRTPSPLPKMADVSAEEKVSRAGGTESFVRESPPQTPPSLRLRGQAFCVPVVHRQAGWAQGFCTG